MAEIIDAVSHQPTELISMGFHASPDTALQIALRKVIVMICERTGSPRQAPKSAKRDKAA